MKLNESYFAAMINSSIELIIDCFESYIGEKEKSNSFTRKRCDFNLMLVAQPMKHYL